jgi:hypothetical protein
VDAIVLREHLRDPVGLEHHVAQERDRVIRARETRVERHTLIGKRPLAGRAIGARETRGSNTSVASSASRFGPSTSHSQIVP